jgi:UDP-N-acetylglucosamine acyltransferase
VTAGIEVHASSFVDPRARIAGGVAIGPFCVVGPEAVLEDGVVLDSHVRIEGRTTLRRGVKVHAGAILGGPPQDQKYRPETVSYLEIGEDTVLREGVTASVGTTPDSTTRIGARCMLMAYSHVGHNTTVGDEVVLANGVQLAGHVEVQDFAVIGGLVPVHQFCRIGRYAFVGGGCRVGKDVPPFLRAAGEPLRPSSLNLVGLSRRGFAPETLRALKSAFRLLYRQDLLTEDALARIRAEVPPLPEVEEFTRFVASSLRGIIR